VSSSEYVGVFKPVASLDSAFARAEPPTHDAWRPNLVSETKHRRFVAVALRSVREIASVFVQRTAALDARSAGPIDAALATLFEGPDIEPQRRLPRVIVGDVRLLAADEHHVSEIDFTVEHADDSLGTVVTATARIATHDGWTVERVDGGDNGSSDAGEVVGFSGPDERWQPDDRLVVGRDDPDRWSVRVRSGATRSIGVDLIASDLREADA
jgi:hypothetical protein